MGTLNAMLLTDGYKLDHRRQYPKGTEFVYSNWTPRSNRHMPFADGAIVFGIQYLCKEYLINYFNKNFFKRPKDEVINSFKRRVDAFLGPNEIGTQHIEELHDLGYLPIELRALPEGYKCPIGVPCMTIVNTDSRFFWVTNFLETIISNVLWLPMTSATMADLYKKELVRHAKKTGFYDESAIGFQCHDFSMRGMAGLDATIGSGMGHLTSFCGTDSLPAIEAVEQYYNADVEKELIGMGVPATEHSVMCAGGENDEYSTFKRLLTELYPNGFVSIVSDTWDYWKVITEIIPSLKNEIMNRNGRFVVRPDSGDPVKIICGDPDATDEFVRKGTYEYLWDIFGGTKNEAGFKVLDNHIGVIYGDAITYERQKEIYRQLEEKGFAATNLVMGIGSYTYNYTTRDALGFAMKATWCQINGQPKNIFKDPKTVVGMTKKSLKGLIVVKRDENGVIYAKDRASWFDVTSDPDNLLQPVFRNGELVKETTLKEIRENIVKGF